MILKKHALRRRVLRVLGAVCVLFCYAWIPRASAAAQALTWQFPLSGIVLDGVHSEPRSNYDVANRQAGPVYFVDCAKVTNSSVKPLLFVQLAFALVSADGSPIGRVITYDVERSDIPTVGLTRSFCIEHGYAGGVEGQVLVGWVNAVLYADGTHWSVAPPVGGIALAPKASGVQLSEPATYLPSESCADIQNVSGKEIRRVQLSFEYINRAGNILQKDVLDVHQRLPDGNKIYHACRSFEGVSDRALVYYARPVSSNTGPVRTAEIFCDGEQVNLVVRVIAVDFSDGSEFRV